MILPFVRELLSDLEHSEGFERVRRHLARAAESPVVVMVTDNKAADSLQLVLRAACELTGAIDPAQVLRLPAPDVLPFEGLSPHPEVQEQRASVLWKIVTGAAAIVIVPVEAASM